MARLVSLSILLALIIFLGMTFYQVVAPFLLPLFLAGIMAMICQPLFRHFITRTGGRVRLAAGLATGVVMSAILIPIVFIVAMASLQLFTFAHYALDSNTWRKAIHSLAEGQESAVAIERLQRALPGLFGPEEIDSKQVEQWQEQFRTGLQSSLSELSRKSLGLAGRTVNTTFSLAAGLVTAGVGLSIFAIALYYFFADGLALLDASEKLIPVHVDYQRQLRERFQAVVRAVVMATFLAAMAQGLATAAALWIAGFGHFFAVAAIATIAALIPVAGTMLIWGPYVVWLGYTGHWTACILLALFGAGVISTMDNVIRAFVLQSDAKLHPLLAFVSVLGGLQMLGLWGIFVGPIVASFLHALIQIFNTELKALSADHFGGQGLAALMKGQPQPSPPGEEPAAEPSSHAGKSTPEDNSTERPAAEPDPSESGSQSASNTRRASEQPETSQSGDEGAS